MAAQHQSRDCPLCLCELLLARDEASDVVLGLALVDKSLHVMQAVERGSADPRLVLVKLGRVGRNPPWGSSHCRYLPFSRVCARSERLPSCCGGPLFQSRTSLSRVALLVFANGHVLRALSKTAPSRRTSRFEWFSPRVPGAVRVPPNEPRQARGPPAVLRGGW